MTRRFSILGLAVFITLTAAHAPAEPPKVEVIGVTEVRRTGATGPTDDRPPDAGLLVTLRVTGVTDAARYGKVVVARARDDAGTDLAPPPDAQANKATPFPRATKHEGGVVTDLPPFYVRINLKTPARQARRIASLKGEIHVVSGGPGERKKVTLPGLKALRGKTAQHPDLARAGITVQVADQGQLEPLELCVTISGQIPADVDLAIVAADGKTIASGGAGVVGANAVPKLVRLDRPLQETDSLVLTLPSAPKPVTIPFDLKDVELP